VKILIAADDVISRQLLAATLKKLGHEVTIASDGREAVQRLSAEDAPRFAILDWMMPELDGLEVCRQLRKRGDPYVYIILLTARSEHADMVRALDGDVDDFLAKPFDIAELKARLRSGARILDLQEGLVRSREELRHLATHDHLTGTLNRRAVVDQLDIELRRASRDGTSVAVVIADLDHFKHVNDRYGHSAGDAVLVQAAVRIRSVLRGHDVIGRYGGEEFLIILPDCGPVEAVEAAARACQAVATSPTVTGDTLLSVTASAGIATTRSGATAVQKLIDAADKALYRAKAAGRNRIELSAQDFGVGTGIESTHTVVHLGDGA
jgi:diguanylate cyclase (GGDEF)-like protein